MSRFGATAAATIFGLTSGGNFSSSYSDKEALLANSLMPFGTSIRRNIGSSLKSQDMFLASNGIEFGTPPDTQSQTKAIPAIDFNNLPYQQQVKKMAEQWREKYKLPGVWCALIKDGKVVACVASGTRNIETGAKASVDDHLNVGSVSKAITGTLIAELVAQGVISYNTTIGETFPELASKYPNSPFNKANLRQFLVHTSGLTGSIKFRNGDEADGKAWRYKHIIDAMASSGIREPGTVYEYAAGGEIATAMVERVIERKGLTQQFGSTYEEWLHGSLGKAIGLTNPRMKNYAVVPNNADVMTYYLTQEGVIANRKALPESFLHATSGSCSITVKDLCSFAISTMNNAMGLPEDIYYDITHFRKGDIARNVTSASWEGNDQRYLHHAGSTGRGEICNFWVSPTRKAALIFYTNVSCQPSEGGANKFWEHIDGLYKGDLNQLRLDIAPIH